VHTATNGGELLLARDVCYSSSQRVS
jgi:hypothetical protein